jgi:hypothetical protein
MVLALWYSSLSLAVVAVLHIFHHTSMHSLLTLLSCLLLLYNYPSPCHSWPHAYVVLSFVVCNLCMLLHYGLVRIPVLCTHFHCTRDIFMCCILHIIIIIIIIIIVPPMDSSTKSSASTIWKKSDKWNTNESLFSFGRKLGEQNDAQRIHCRTPSSPNSM